MTEDRRRRIESDGDGKLFNFRPLTFFACFLALGIAIGYFIAVLGGSWLFGLLAVPLAFGVAVFSLPKNRWVISILLLCLCVAIGAISFCGSVADFTKQTVYDGKHTATGVVEEKSRWEGGYYVTLGDLTIDANAENGKMIAYLPTSLGEKVRLADEIVLVGKIQTNTDLQGDYGFRASAIVRKQYFRASKVENLLVVDSAPRPLLHVRQRVYDVLDSGMDDQAAAFSAGLLIGDDSRIEKGLLQNIRHGGIAHLFAVSGLHIGVLFALCLRLTKGKFFKEKHKIVSWLFVAAVLLLYGGVCGFSASIFRAVFTCLFAYAYTLFGLKRDSLEGLSFAAFLLLLFAPAYLFDVGFLLSFAACYGILLFASPIAKAIKVTARTARDVWRYKIRKKPKQEESRSIFDGDTPPDSIAARVGNKIVSFASVTLAAWLATSCVMLGYFRNLSVWGLLFNLLFVPVLSSFYILLLALVALSCILPLAASSVLLFMPNAVLGVVILLFELLPLGSAEIPFFIVGFICLYLGLICTTDKFNLSRKTRFMLALVALIAAFICFIGPIFV